MARTKSINWLLVLWCNQTQPLRKDAAFLMRQLLAGSFTKEYAMQTRSLYQSVTDTIIKDLEAGVPSWIKPWIDGNAGGDIMPINFASGRQYSGINIPILWHSQQVHGYPTSRWLTFKQALPLEACVRKGERSTTVVFTKKVTIKKDTEDDKQLSVMRTFHVFNVAQIDGLPDQPNPRLVDFADGDINQNAALRFIQATKADIRIGGDRAFYTPTLDFIQIPPEQAFTGREHYLATALHELAHWTGSKKRLDRDLSGRFKTRSYAAEELVAELSAAFLCAHLGIKGELRHAEYIGNWLELLKDDDRAIFTAASKASQAADYLRGFSETVAEEAA
jgi:antirestriction protein ArdC